MTRFCRRRPMQSSVAFAAIARCRKRCTACEPECRSADGLPWTCSATHNPKGNFPLRDDRSDDKCLVTNYVGQYQANAWGLKDMVGNVSEWTRSSYRPYPYAQADGRNDANPKEEKVARGGSWEDRPVNATASARFAYEPYQKVYNVGIRIVIPAD